MKKLILLSFALAIASFANAQDPKTEWVNAADPTQLYSNIDFNAAIKTGSMSGIWGPDYWEANLGGEYAIKMFNFGFNVPFTNIGNVNTLLGDIDLHVGFQPFNGDKLIKSSLITAGFSLATSFNGEGYNDDWATANNIFYLNYIASIRLNNKFSVYPKIGFEIGDNVDQTAPDINLKAYEAGLGLNYQINTKSFLQLNANYKYTTRKIEGEQWTFFDEKILESNSVLVSLKYQYAISTNAQLYARIQNAYGERYTQSDFPLFEGIHQQGLFLGFQYYVK